MNTYARISRISVALLCALFGLFFLTSTVLAQQTRVAYIDAEKLLKRMPEAKDAQSRLDQLTSSWNSEAQNMQSDIVRKQAEYDRRKLIMTDAERNAAELDLTNLKKKHDDFLQSKFGPDNGELYQQQAGLMKPAYDRLTSAIKECALDGNYDYVIDRTSKDVVLLYVNSKFDLTLAVARKLGIESEILTTPLVNPNPNAPKNGQPVPGTQPGATNTPGTTQPGTTPGTNGTFPSAFPGTTQSGTGTGTTGIPNTGFQNPAVTPNNSGGTNPPNFNSGGNNPNQQPPPPQTPPSTGH